MADFSQSVVASLSRALNAAKVPCVLWGSLPARSPWRAIYHRGKYLDPDKLFESRSETNTASSRSTSSFQMRVWKPRRKPSLNALACSSPVQHRNRASRHRRSDTHSRRPSTPTSKATLKLRLASTSNPTLSGFSRRSTVHCCPPAATRTLDRILPSHPTGPSSPHGDLVEARVFSSQPPMPSWPPRPTFSWRHICASLRATKASVSAPLA